MDGILNINKPQGKTSFSIVSLVRRLSGERRVGHAGTLDPIATGVLPVCLGQGTRVVEFLADAPKTYRAQIELGVATDTFDASGRITYRSDASRVSREQLESALAPFSGLIQQIPPMYSALKYRGRPLYQLARSGIEVERPSRPVKILRLELLDWQPPVATIEIECGKGTYIRSLANDLGQALGCGANMKSLIRSSYGPFELEHSVSLSQLEEAFGHGYWPHFLYPIDAVLRDWTAVVVSDATGRALSQGSPLPPGEHGPLSPPVDRYCRVYTSSGRFLGVLRFNRERGEWQPKKVFVTNI